MLKDQYTSSEITAGFPNAIFMRTCWRQSHLIPENKNLKWIILNCNCPLVRKFGKSYCFYNWNAFYSVNMGDRCLQNIYNLWMEKYWYFVVYMYFNVIIFREKVTLHLSFMIVFQGCDVTWIGESCLN